MASSVKSPGLLTPMMAFTCIPWQGSISPVYAAFFIRNSWPTCGTFLVWWLITVLHPLFAYSSLDFLGGYQKRSKGGNSLGSLMMVYFPAITIGFRFL